MWDFSFGKSVGMILRTLPFIVLRLVVYVGIAVAYIFAVGVGAFIGFALGHLWSSPDAPMGGAFWGGLIGFGFTSALLYLAREYLLYLVKAAHIAVLVEIMDGHSVPSDQTQIGYGANFVKSHFAESSILFGVDQIIKAVLRALFGIVNFFAMFLPVPGLQNLVRLAESVVRMSLTYVDEVILAYLIRTRTANPWQTAEDGLVLYAQNYRHFLKNALWLWILMWFVTILIFAVLLGPVGALVWMFPGHNAGLWAFVLALIFAVALKKALLEPLAIASLMQVFFKTIEGQTPDPEWSARLSQASGKFRELAQKAAGWMPRPPENPAKPV
ncbi:MAG TPA: hypothetical protein VIM56_05540 [Rhizomicrobium sp.]